MLVNSGQASRLPATIGGGFGSALPAPDVATLQQLAGDLGGQLQWLQQGHHCPPAHEPDYRCAPGHGSRPLAAAALLPLALLARIGTLWLVLVGALLLTPSLQASPAPTALPPAAHDNQAWQAFLQKRYQEAARAFADPVWQGNAWYRAGDYAKAVPPMAGASTATAHYNRGNALVQLGQLAAPSRPIWRRWRWSQAIRMHSTT